MGKCHEKERTYIFDNIDLCIPNVVNVDVSSSGGMVYVAPKWLAIEIDSEFGWEF